MTTPGSAEAAPTPTEPEVPPAAGRARAQRLLGWMGLVAVIAGAVLSSNMFSIRDRLFGSAVPRLEVPAASRDASIASRPLAPTTLRSAPWWQDVTALKGAGSMTSSPFTIGAGASQWRVEATCQSGHLQGSPLGLGVD